MPYIDGKVRIWTHRDDKSDWRGTMIKQYHHYADGGVAKLGDIHYDVHFGYADSKDERGNIIEGVIASWASFKGKVVPATTVEKFIRGRMTDSARGNRHKFRLNEALVDYFDDYGFCLDNCRNVVFQINPIKDQTSILQAAEMGILI